MPFVQINYLYIENLYQEEAEDGDFDSEIDDFTLLQNAFVDLYMNEKKQDREYLGHQIADMLVGCTFNGKRCSQKMFKLHQTSEYGNCWAISSDGFNVRNAGPTGGLSLVLFLETNEYLRGITTGFGTRVVVQERNTYPFPAHEGMFIPASMETDIGLKMVSVTRLGGKYGSCDDGEDFKNSHNVTYTRRACQAFCEVSTVINNCSCFDDHSEEFAVTKNITIRPCRSRKEVKCLGRIRRMILRQNLDCNCDIPCSEISYRKTISSRQWPSDEYARVLLDWVCKRDTTTCANLRQKLSNMRDLSNNFLKLNIYYEDLNFENITETAQIELQQFLSDIGGAFGLWIGLSILSLCELLQLFVELIAYTVCKPRTHRRQGEHEREKEESYHNKDNDDEPKDDRMHRKEHNYHGGRVHERYVHNDGFTHYRPFEQPHRHDQYSHGRRDPNEEDITDRSRERPRHHGPHGDKYDAPKWHGQLHR